MAAQNLSAQVSNIKDKIKNVFTADKAPLWIVIVITILLFVFVIVYITFAMKSSNLQGKLINGSPIYLPTQMKPVTVLASDLPATVAGREFSYSMWMYIDDFQRGSDTNHFMILYRGVSDSINGANPIVFMDAQSNKLYVAIRTTGSSLAGNSLDSLLKTNWFVSQDKNLAFANANKHVILTVDYIPLQRWVNVMVIVDNKLMSLYMDGELYSVKSVDEFKGSSNNTLGSVNYNLVMEKTDGNVYIGKNPVAQQSYTIDGYIGKVEFFNYAINQDEVRRIYQYGPLSSTWLSMFGITQYGVRSPIYKLNEVDE